MKMNKKAAGILLAAMSTMIFTGCGSSESERRLIMRQQAVRSLLSPVRMEVVHAVPL